MNTKDALISAVNKLIDKSDKIVDLAVSLGVGYYGFRTNDHWTGGLAGILGYKLATSNNLPAGAAGIATLTAMGVANLTKPQWTGQQRSLVGQTTGISPLLETILRALAPLGWMVP